MSRIYVFVILTFVAVVILGVGCRTFSEDVKDEAPSVESRPSLSSEGAPEKKDEAFDDEIGKAAEKEFNLGLEEEKQVSRNSLPAEAKKHMVQAEAHYYNALNAVPDKIAYVEAWGRVALKALGVEKSEAKLAPLVKTHPGEPQLVIVYSRILVRQKKYQQALEALQGCLEINMDSVLLCRELLLLYFEAGQLSQAKEFYEWMDENGLLFPAEVIIYGACWKSCRDALVKGEKDKLPKDFNYTKAQCDEMLHSISLKACRLGEVLAKEGELPVICGIGLFLAEVGEKDLYREYVKRKASIPEICNTVAFMLMIVETNRILGDKERAMAAAVVLERSRNNLTDDVLFRLIECFGKLNEPAHSARLLETLALRQKAPNPKLLDELMVQYLLAKEYDNVILSFQLYGKPTEFGRYALGVAYKEKEKYRAAYNELILIADSKNPINGFWLYMQLSIVCQKLGRRDEVVKYAEKAWRMKPEESMLCNFYGYTLADYGLQLDLAQELIEKALKAQPKNVAYLDSLAWVFFKRGDTAKAEEVMRKLLEIGLGENGDDWEIPLHLGDIFFANGKRDEAVKYWKEALRLVKDADVKKELEQKVNSQEK